VARIVEYVWQRRDSIRGLRVVEESAGLAPLPRALRVGRLSPRPVTA